MKSEKQLLKALKTEAARETPDSQKAVLACCKEAICQTEAVQRKRVFVVKNVRRMALVASLALLVALGTMLGVLEQNDRVADTVMLDVNPSIRLEINQKDQVLHALGNNEDGQNILKDVDVIGAKAEDAVADIVDAMYENGYITEATNSVLISVENNAALLNKLSSKTQEKINGYGFSGSIMSQQVTESEALKQTAQELGISTGKAQLISNIVQADEEAIPEELSKLKINDLNLIASTAPLQENELEVLGQASASAYIGEDAAKAIVRAALGWEEDKGLFSVKFNSADGKVFYSVKTRTETMWYNYSVDATTGAVNWSKSGATGGADTGIPSANPDTGAASANPDTGAASANPDTGAASANPDTGAAVK